VKREKLEKVNVKQLDCRLTKDGRGVIQPGHNGQIAVDDR